MLSWHSISGNAGCKIYVRTRIKLVSRYLNRTWKMRYNIWTDGLGCMLFSRLCVSCVSRSTWLEDVVRGLDGRVLCSLLSSFVLREPSSDTNWDEYLCKVGRVYWLSTRGFRAWSYHIEIPGTIESLLTSENTNTYRFPNEINLVRLTL